MTNANGNYFFTDVEPGVMCSVVVDQSSSPALDDKVIGNCPEMFDVILAPAESFLDADFCFILPCSECDGNVTQLTLQNNGPGAQIRVEQKKHKKQKKKNVTVFDEVVQPGEQFTFIGTDKGTLGTEISIFVDAVLNTKIHSSCSQPIGPALISGDFEAIEGFSKKGGPLYP